MKLRSLSAEFIKNKRVLLRVDYNTPMQKIGQKYQIVDDTRLQITLPTIKFLLKNKAKIIICSHLGRPEGKFVAKYKLDPIAKHLEKLLGQPVKKINVSIGPEAQKAVADLEPGQILMLENTRFHPGEKANSPEFAQQLASLAEVFVNDGLAVSHRAHASVVGVTNYLPSLAGFALIEEVSHLESLIKKPQHPFVAIVGGAKISDKVEAIRNLSEIANVVLVGGGVANNFLKADGVEVYRSYLEETSVGGKKKKISFVKIARNLLRKTKAEKMLLRGYIPLPKIIYPFDVIATDNLDHPTKQKTIILADDNDSEEKQNWMFVDIGPKTQKLFREVILQAKTVFWNGPMGVFEQKKFAQGTQAIASAVAQVKGKTVVGGGDTISAIKNLGFEKRFDFLSAAGGAALELLGGKLLPGLKPLLKK
ncbi:MAG: phosphoglycerate kinase [Candidatus Pacebacteria bacterium RIFOXYB1_FULL_39_46]|nr:MAG: phosphoglycerate kinase [Candidatus Pacebacteria bacterium RIFOXYA1_FULL_38_18]OGJ37947.1 MAG: phosphoglycerate kinase [Candidatus Pacebacteria bacterium RIFOXYB1_FULL_39_46]OGJ39545.1 MAG: phosphoglycerate kinase [Candidatus Pacebacteria bacterium RIFOXYC1_FULL_39_21]OGJ40126.1 MAG: phosphoglycerate kinase [Candidatus Pacebacteria bacterium RIFOXYD1_FULL_39_27]